MEHFNNDVFSVFISGVALGIIIGHQIYKRLESKLEYLRGHNDGVNELWPHLAEAWKDIIRLQHLAAARAETNGGDAGDQKAV